jgi:hypothetical protein
MSGDAEDVHGPDLDLHHEKHMHTPQEDGVHVQER